MRGTPIVYSNFSGGVNVRDNPYMLETNEALDLRNVVSTERGTVTKRNGNTTLSSSFAAPNFELNSLYYSRQNAKMVAVGNNNAASHAIYSITEAGTVATITGTMGTPGSNSPWAIAEGPPVGTVGTTVYFMPPSTGGNPQKWTGSGNTTTWTATSGTVPHGSSMVYHGGHMWAAGGVIAANQLLWSDFGDPSAWTSTNKVTLESGTGDGITALCPMGSYLVVFKESKTYLIYDLETGANRQVSANIGCPSTSAKTIARAPEGIYFYSNNRTIELFDGADFKTISSKINPIIGASQGWAGVYRDRHYYWTENLASSTSLMYDYDVETNSWWIHEMTAHYQDMVAIGAQIYGIPDNDAVQTRVDKLFVPSTYQDYGGNFTAYWSQPWIPMGAPAQRKRWRQVHVDGSGTVDLHLAKDFGAYAALGTNIFSASSTETEARLYTPGVARAGSLKFTSAANAPYEIDAVTIAYELRKN